MAALHSKSVRITHWWIKLCQISHELPNRHQSTTKIYCCIIVCVSSMFITVGRLFSRATNFANILKKGSLRKLFSQIYIGVFSLVCIHVTIEFLLIFGETNFVQVPAMKSANFVYSPQKKGTLRYGDGSKSYLNSVKCNVELISYS